MEQRGSPAEHPAPQRAPGPLTPAERWLVAGAALAPVAVAAVVLVPVAAGAGAGPGDVVVAAAVYGGLLGLAAGVVTFDRVQARQCPRCRRRSSRADDVCGACGYDLRRRPRWVCAERHRVHLEPGLCACGRRLAAVEPTPRPWREVRWTLLAGAWLLALLLAVGLALRLLS